MTTSNAEANHAARLHSLCSASGAERWLNCPGSVGLSRTVPEEPSGAAAQEGTRAHELAEAILKHWLDSGRKRNIDPNVLEQYRAKYRDTEQLTGDGRIWSMVDYAMTYVNACIDEVESFDCGGKNVAVRLEQRLTFNEEMKMFGTADFMCTGIKGGKPCGSITDLKYGKKRVKVEGNPQLAYYAVALKKMSKKELAEVKVRVVQPRIPQWYSDITYDVEQLREWNKTLTLGAEKALIQIGWQNPELKTGGWCWFCPARDVCPEKRKEKAGVFDDDIDIG